MARPTARTPINTPTSTVPALAQWQASGLPPASGFDRSGFYCEDWYIETQFMNYAYMRVPIGSVSSMNFGLSSMGINTAIDGTTILVQFTTITTATSSHYCYETSTFFQPQQFEVNSFPYDAYGISYGTAAAGTYGPAGSVVSYKPFINRRKIVHWEDELYNESRAGTNWGIVTVRSVAECGDPDSWVYPGAKLGLYAHPVKEYLFSNNTSLLQGAAPWCGSLTIRQTGARLASKPGNYSTGQDSVNDVQEATDILGHLVHFGNHLRDDENRNLTADPNYDPNRHYWA